MISLGRLTSGLQPGSEYEQSNEEDQRPDTPPSPRGCSYADTSMQPQRKYGQRRQRQEISHAKNDFS